ncbi:MAG: AAA family ATPase [Candidatus Baldrarchaeia archaeon]
MENRVNEVMQKLVNLRNCLVNSFVQRENEVSGVISALLCREACILVGPPGTAKTKLLTTLSKAINGKIFQIWLSPETDEDAILGPLDIKGYREGRLRRIMEGFLPDADLVLIHEVFRGNRGIRDALLSALEEKIVKVGGVEYPLKVLGFYFDTNFVSYDEEDRAFWDRMVIRCWVNYVSSDAWEDLIKTAIDLEANNDVQAFMTIDDIRFLQNLVRDRFLSLKNANTLIRKYILALTELKNQGVEISDRKKIKVLKVTSALSILYLEKNVSIDSLADALRLCVPDDEDDLSKIEQVIMKCQLSSYYTHIQQLQTLHSELKNAIAQFMSKEKKTIDDLKMISTVRKKALQVLKSIPRNPRLLPYVRPLLETLDESKKIIEKVQEEILSNND